MWSPKTLGSRTSAFADETAAANSPSRHQRGITFSRVMDSMSLLEKVGRQARVGRNEAAWVEGVILLDRQLKMLPPARRPMMNIKTVTLTAGLLLGFASSAAAD
jgi:hypothetical protein